METKRTPMYSVYIGCQITTSCQNIFDIHWHGFLVHMELYGRDTASLNEKLPHSVWLRQPRYVFCIIFMPNKPVIDHSCPVQKDTVNLGGFILIRMEMLRHRMNVNVRIALYLLTLSGPRPCQENVFHTIKEVPEPSCAGNKRMPEGPFWHVTQMYSSSCWEEVKERHPWPCDFVPLLFSWPRPMSFGPFYSQMCIFRSNEVFRQYNLTPVPLSVKRDRLNLMVPGSEPNPGHVYYSP